MAEAQLLLLAGALALTATGLLLVAGSRQKRQKTPPPTGTDDHMGIDLTNLRRQLISLKVSNPGLPAIPMDIGNVQLFAYWFAQAKQTIATDVSRRTKEHEKDLLHSVVALEAEFNALIKIANERAELTNKELNDLKLEDQKESLRASIAAHRAKQDSFRHREESPDLSSAQERKFNAAWEDEKRDRRWKARQSLGKVHDLRALRDECEEQRKQIEGERLTREEREEYIEILEQECEQQKRKIKTGGMRDIFEH